MPHAEPFKHVDGREYLLGDPRIPNIYRQLVFNYAWEHFEPVIGWDRERELRGAHHAAGKYADKVFAAVKLGSAPSAPTGPQVKAGIGPAEAQQIRQIVLDVVDRHLAKIGAALSAYQPAPEG